MRRLIFLTTTLLTLATGVARAENACENLRRRAKELRNGAQNCDNAVSQKVMSACMVRVTFSLPDVPQFITPDAARTAAASLDAVGKLNDLQKCRAAGGRASTADSTNTFLVHAATAERLKSILANIDPYVTATREPDPRCPDGNGGFTCSCPTMKKDKPNCNVSCTGTCYQWGGKKGAGIDCSGLIGAGNPTYWANSGRIPRDCPGHADNCDDDDKTFCPDLSAADDCTCPDPESGVNCGSGTQRQLQLLKNDGRDNIENAEDFRAGDALYLKAGSDGPVHHVVQLVGDPTCDQSSGHQVCTMNIIESPQTGSPVQSRTVPFVDGCYCSHPDKSGGCPTPLLCIAGGGTAP